VLPPLADIIWPVLVALGIEQVRIQPGMTAFKAIGPPPPSITAIVVAGIAGAAVIVSWAWWFDRHRSPVG
jgi:hypothetical protein